MSDSSFILKPLIKAVELTEKRLLSSFNIYDWCYVALLVFISHLPIDPAILPDTIIGLFAAFLVKSGCYFKESSFIYAFFLVSVFVVLFLVIAWIRYIGKFMFLNVLFYEGIGLEELWVKSYKKGTTCFIVFVALFLISLLLMGVLIGFCSFANGLFHRLFGNSFFRIVVSIYWAIPVLFAFVLVGLPFIVLKDFIVPMLDKGINIHNAFVIIFGLVVKYPFHFLIYFCIRTLLWGGLIVLVLVLGLLTFGIMVLPLIKILILLPLYVLVRLYPICVLEYFSVFSIEDKIKE